jgi:iron complex transport system substrate-binding protein
MRRAAAMALLLVSIIWQPCAAAALHLMDDRGVTVDIAQPPQRIVTLLPSLTETVCALGACARLIGVDRYSNWPQSVTSLPQLGGMLDPDIERIVALRPDLVVLGVSSRAASRLEAAGIKVFALEQKSYEGVHRAIDTLGAILALPGADRLWEKIQDDVNAVAQSLPLQARHGATRHRGLT